MLLSILIPAYEEGRTIGEVLRRVAEIDTESAGFEKEIIVCDDGSKDDTVAEVERAMAKDPRIKLIQHPVNRGKGAAIRSCLQIAEGEYCLVQDADLEYEVTDYPALLAEVRKGAEAVYGSRFLTRRWPKGMKLPNFVANRMLSFTANALYRVGITDEATCFKVFRTDLLRSLDLECERFEFCPEVTAKLGKRKVHIAEVPIEYQAREVEDGKKIRWTDGLEAMLVLLKHRIRRDR